MADFKQLMSEEVRRLARKELRVALAPMAEAVSALKKQVAELKEEMEQRQAPPAREWSTDVIVPEVVVDEMPPPVARQAFGFGGATPTSGTAALADLERRAQQELARIGPLRVKKFFKLKK